MKLLNKIFVFTFGCVALLSCADLDTVPEDGIFTADQKKAVVEALPERLSADVNGMFSIIGKQFCVFGSTSSRDDDAGYPTVCLSQDLNGPDMVGDNSNYNWFSVSSEYSDRSDTYANPYERWAVFYNQLKLANDILASIPSDTEIETLKIYKAQAKAVRAFDYLSLVPYYQFKYKGNEDQPSVPIVTDNMEGDPSNNPRAALKDVYALIMSDLNEAIQFLEGYERKGKSEIDQKIAYGLRARANLYMENWTEAAADADKAMAGYTPYSREEVSQPTFVDSNDHNWMWAIILKPTNFTDAYPSWPSVLGSFSGDSYSAGAGCYKSINNLLFNKISSTDVRKGWWVDENLHSDNLKNVTWVAPNGYIAKGDEVASFSINDVKLPFIPYTNVKFGQFDHIGNNINAGDWCIMRVEEMILIKAEATAMAGNLSSGKQILENFVKTYRDPSYASLAGDASSFQDEVWLQRRIELWGEGFAMSDIMRLGKNIVRFNSTTKTNFPDAFKFNIASNDGWLLLRLPQKETNNNRGIPVSANNNGGTQPISGAGAGLKDGVTD